MNTEYPNMSERFLSKKQKGLISKAAAKAYYRSHADLYYDSMDDYRHAVCREVCNLPGVSCATQQHFIPLYNAFARAAGMPEMENRTPRTQLEREVYLLRKEMDLYEFSEGYVLPIMLARLGQAMPQPFDTLCLQLGAEGVKQVKYTVINRGRRKLRETEERFDLPPVTEFRTPATMPPDRLAEHFGCEVEGKVRSRNNGAGKPAQGKEAAV